MKVSLAFSRSSQGVICIRSERSEGRLTRIYVGELCSDDLAAVESVNSLVRGVGRSPAENLLSSPLHIDLPRGVPLADVVAPSSPRTTAFAVSARVIDR